MKHESLDPVLDKAKQILAERKRKDTCIQAGICPTCREPLTYYSDACLTAY